MTNSLMYLRNPINATADQPGSSLIVVNNATFASVNVNNMTAGTVVQANNRAITSGSSTFSYTFTGTYDEYSRIFSSQCNRVGTFIYNQLGQLDRTDEDQNEAIVDSIADVIALVGEPASGTAVLEAGVLKDDWFLFEHLLLGIANADHKDTEAYRLQFLLQYVDDPDYRLKRAAIRALGRMKTEEAKKTLREISTISGGGELAMLATALLR
jgi:HEAT repeat protein